MELYADDGSGQPESNSVGYNDDGDDLPDGYNEYASRIVYTALASGTYWAKMRPYDDGQGTFDFNFASTCLISQAYCAEEREKVESWWGELVGRAGRERW